ncbi:hypothetical protein GCM10011386_37460 [Parapedobacter defluvii]|uniref:Uncharacterized protein n=2 Tax=Parapedobacter defluvii TaxID=2045106 RepID=A0ABQ1MJN0_9SPHI|nr:hypothetical protein GCM10011386_37460 [Parapedobacter defluvii]
MENNPLVLYRQWLMKQYVVWADAIASAAMDSFDALYHESIRLFGVSVEEMYSFVSPDGQNDGMGETYRRGKHTLRLLSYIEHTLAKRNVGITALIASLLFEITEKHKPVPLSENEYKKVLDRARSDYHQAITMADQASMKAYENHLKTLEEDQEARRFMDETWRSFSETKFNPHTIAAFGAL